MIVEPLDQRHRDLRHRAVACPSASKLGWDHPRIVEDKRIARRQQLRKIADHAIGNARLAVRIDDKQP